MPGGCSLDCIQRRRTVEGDESPAVAYRQCQQICVGDLARAEDRRPAQHAPRPAPARSRADHRRGRRRPQWHRHLLAGRRAVRLLDAVDRRVHAVADDRDPGDQRAHRLRHRARPVRQDPRAVPAAGAVRDGRHAARGQHAEHRRRPRRDGRGPVADPRGLDARLRGHRRTAVPGAAGVPVLPAPRARAEVAVADAACLRGRRVLDPGRLASGRAGNRMAEARAPATQPICSDVSDRNRYSGTSRFVGAGTFFTTRPARSKREP